MADATLLPCPTVDSNGKPFDEAKVERASLLLVDLHPLLGFDSARRIVLTAGLPRQPQVPAEDVELQISMRISELEGDRRNFDHLSREDQRELGVLRRIRKALTALQVTEGDKVERQVEAAYREGHCDGRDLARTGRQGSECMDWLDSETHAALHSKQEGEG